MKGDSFRTKLMSLVILFTMPHNEASLRTTTPHVTGIEGSELTLNCNTDDHSDGTVKWHIHADAPSATSSHLPDDGLYVGAVTSDRLFLLGMSGSPWKGDVGASGTSHLVIYKLKLDRDDGYFTCSMRESYITIRVTVLVPVKTVSLEPANSTTLSTEQAPPTLFICTVTSKPRATITWQLVQADTSIITLSDANESISTRDKLINVTSKLSYTPHKAHNGGSIQCIAQNTANTSPFESNDTRLIIHWPPDSINRISGYTSPDPITESSSESLQLTCRVTGVPNPNTLIYSWSSGCGTEAGSTSQQISVPRSWSMNNAECHCTVTHSETGWKQNSPPVKFNIIWQWAARLPQLYWILMCFIALLGLIPCLLRSSFRQVFVDRPCLLFNQLVSIPLGFLQESNNSKVFTGDNSTCVDACNGELLLIERRRLEVDVLRLGVETERLAVEQQRLALEKERLQFDRERERHCNSTNPATDE